MECLVPQPSISIRLPFQGFIFKTLKIYELNFFLIRQLMWIPSGAMVTDGLDSSRGMEQQCVIVEDRTAGAQHRHRHFSSQYIRLSESFCCWEKTVKVLLIISFIPQTLSTVSIGEQCHFITTLKFSNLSQSKNTMWSAHDKSV